MRPMRIEILGFDGCPNTPVLDRIVRQALSEAGIDAEVVTVDVMKLASDDARRRWPSPTVLVRGDDLLGLEKPKEGSICCRSYPGGLPSTAAVIEALHSFMS